MSELVAATPRKASISAYGLVVAIAAVVGAAGILLSPLHFAALVVGVLLMAAALARTEVALALLVFVVPLIGAKAKVGPIPIDAVTICTGIVLLSYAINHLGKGGERLRNPFTWAFIAFLLFSGVSLVVAPSVVQSASVIVRFIGYFLLVPVIGRSIRSKQSLTWILVLMVVSAAITGMYGIYQYLYAPQTAKIGLYDLSGDVAARVGSTFENPNFYAEYLVLLVPIGLALVLGSRGLFRRLVMAGATGLIFAGLILTYTRGSWLSTGIGVVLMSLLTQAWLFWVWVALFAVAYLAAPGVASRFASITDITGGTAGFRMKLWTIAAGIIREHPWLGIGIGNYYSVFTEYIFRHPELSVGWVIYGAHNSYLTIFAETGIFGILSFVAIILVSVKYGLYLSREKGRDKYLSWVNSAIFAGVVGFSLNSLTSNSFHHPQGAVFFWVLLGLQVAISRLAPEEPRGEASPIIEGSIVLRPLRSSLAVYRVAAQSHIVHRAGVRLGEAWQKSALGGWLFSAPVSPDVLGGSRAHTLIDTLTRKLRASLDGSATLLAVRGIGARPFTFAPVFVGVATAVRMTLGAVL